MRRKWKSRLGVSAVIANMLMILITLSLAAILVAWAGTSFGAFSGGSSLYFLQRGQALQERLVIESAFLIKSANGQWPEDTLLIFVRNVGLIQINIVAIYVNGTSLTPNTGTGLCGLYTATNQVSLGVQGVCEYSLPVTQSNGVVTGGAAKCADWCTGSIFYIVVATARGNQAAYTARGP
jgi:hypothetical protein